jgi:8-oxo-dGTP pyrophosphatase MutT (NUDIX family)
MSETTRKAMDPTTPKQPRRFHRLRRALEPAIRPAMHLYWRFSRPATLGVRALVIDGQGRVFLVKHSYVDGWHLPGGGVETGETMLEALARELAEEGNIALSATPKLHGVFFNKRMSRRDHVALYIVRDFRQDSPPVPDHEIIEHGFFARTALPQDTGRATRARIAEVFDNAAVSELW